MFLLSTILLSGVSAVHSSNGLPDSGAHTEWTLKVRKNREDMGLKGDACKDSPVDWCVATWSMPLDTHSLECFKPDSSSLQVDKKKSLSKGFPEFVQTVNDGFNHASDALEANVCPFLSGFRRGDATNVHWVNSDALTLALESTTSGVSEQCTQWQSIAYAHGGDDAHENDNNEAVSGECHFAMTVATYNSWRRLNKGGRVSTTLRAALPQATGYGQTDACDWVLQNSMDEVLRQFYGGLFAPETVKEKATNHITDTKNDAKDNGDAVENNDADNNDAENNDAKDNGAQNNAENNAIANDVEENKDAENNDAKDSDASVKDADSTGEKDEAADDFVLFDFDRNDENRDAANGGAQTNDDASDSKPVTAVRDLFDAGSANDDGDGSSNGGGNHLHFHNSHDSDDGKSKKNTVTLTVWLFVMIVAATVLCVMASMAALARYVDLSDRRKFETVERNDVDLELELHDAVDGQVTVTGTRPTTELETGAVAHYGPGVDDEKRVLVASMPVGAVTDERGVTVEVDDREDSSSLSVSVMTEPIV